MTIVDIFPGPGIAPADGLGYGGVHGAGGVAGIEPRLCPGESIGAAPGGDDECSLEGRIRHTLNVDHADAVAAGHGQHGGEDDGDGAIGTDDGGYGSGDPRADSDGGGTVGGVNAPLLYGGQVCAAPRLLNAAVHLINSVRQEFPGPWTVVVDASD